jgi:hypothetical protein
MVFGMSSPFGRSIMYLSNNNNSIMILIVGALMWLPSGFQVTINNKHAATMVQTAKPFRLDKVETVYYEWTSGVMNSLRSLCG